MMRRHCTPRSQRGFTLMAAIFIIVILATIMGYMVSLSGTQRATSVLALQGTRAYEGARSGIEWGIQQVFTTPGTMCSSAELGSTPTSFPLSGPGLTGFRVTVNCNYTTHTEKSTTVSVYHLVALAEFDTFGSPDYVSRQLEATVSNAPP
jgi:MSHA biogenesis protein MshP